MFQATSMDGTEEINNLKRAFPDTDIETLFSPPFKRRKVVLETGIRNTYVQKDVTTEIFRYLSVRDKLNCSEVNKEWNEFFWTPNHWSELNVNICHISHVSKHKPLRLFTSSLKRLTLNLRSTHRPDAMLRKVYCTILIDIIGCICDGGVSSVSELTMFNLSSVFCGTDRQRTVILTKKMCQMVRMQRDLRYINISYSQMPLNCGIVVLEAVQTCRQIEEIYLHQMCRNIGINIFPSISRCISSNQNLT
uniref:F-box domain-containing protein n=1 Tax=Biomphalaria glabrata TaxID=6526 RepID=A0A2C9LUT1_BIOGL